MVVCYLVTNKVRITVTNNTVSLLFIGLVILHHARLTTVCHSRLGGVKGKVTIPVISRKLHRRLGSVENLKSGHVCRQAWSWAGHCHTRCSADSLALLQWGQVAIWLLATKVCHLPIVDFQSLLWQHQVWVIKLEDLDGISVRTEWSEISGHHFCHCWSYRLSRRPRTGMEVCVWQLDNAVWSL